MISLLFFIFFIIAWLTIFSPNTKIIKIWVCILSVSFIGISGFRLTSNDYNEYLNLYKNFETLDIEPAFKLISYVVKNFLGGNSIFIFVIFSLIGVYAKIKGILQLSNQVLLCICVYFCNFFLLHEMTQIRAGVASGLLLLSIVQLYNNNLKNFLFIATLAVCFHYSAIIIFPLWFLRNRNNKYWLYSSIFIGYLIYFSGINLIYNIQIPGIPGIQEKIRIYLALQNIENSSVNVFNFVYLSKIVIYYVILFNVKKIAPHNKYTILLLNVYSISLFCYPVFATVPAFASRISEFLGVVDIILIPMLAYLFKSKLMGRIFIVLLSLAYLLMNFYYVKLIIDYKIL